jgi:hypothetical protein
VIHAIPRAGIADWSWIRLSSKQTDDEVDIELKLFFMFFGFYQISHIVFYKYLWMWPGQCYMFFYPSVRMYKLLCSISEIELAQQTLWVPCVAVVYALASGYLVIVPDM